MASQDTRTLLLQINATTEVLRSQMSVAEKAVEEATRGMQSHLEASDARFAAFGESIERLEKPLERLKQAGETAFAFFLGESLIEKGKEALEYAGNIEFMAQQIGVSTDFLQKFRYAASQSGAGIEVSNTALTKFSRSVGEAANGNKAVIELFNKLGVSVLDAGGHVRSVEGVFKDTATGIAALTNPAQRTADTLTLFGRGAGALVPLMKEGADGFDQLATAAKQLGIVLSPEMIEHSEQVNHKLAALKLILDAQMSSAVAQNASAIGDLASQFIKLAGAILKFQSQRPEEAFALLGAAAGSRFGPIGALVGGGVGFTVGSNVHQTNEDASVSHDVRAEAFRRAADAYNAAQRYASSASTAPVYGNERTALAGGSAGNTNLAAASAELARQRKLFSQARSKGFADHGEASNLGSTEAGDHNPNIEREKKGKSAEQLAREAEAARQRKLSEDRAFEGELRTAQTAYAKAEAALADTAQTQLAAEVQSLDAALITRKQQVDDQVSAGKITAARGQQLKAIYEQTEADEILLAERKEQSRLIKEAGAGIAIQIQGQAELLSLDRSLANTRKDRLAIELKLLALQEQAAKNAQLDIIADPTSTRAQVAEAGQRYLQIDAQHSRNVAVVNRQNEGPIDAYRRQLTDAVGDTNDALQNVGVHALQGLDQQLTGTIGKVLGLKGSFGELAASIIEDLARIEIERAILGATSGGGGGLFGAIGRLFGGGRASGGVVDSDKFYVVGEKGPELFAPGKSGTIIPNGAIRAPSIGAVGSTKLSHEVSARVEVSASPLLDVRMQDISVRTTASAVPTIIQAASGHTITQLARQRLGG